MREQDCRQFSPIFLRIAEIAEDFDRLVVIIAAGVVDAFDFYSFFEESRNRAGINRPQGGVPEIFELLVLKSAGVICRQQNKYCEKQQLFHDIYYSTSVLYYSCMLEKGKVVETKGNMAWIELPAGANCSHCRACSGAKPGNNRIEAINRIGAAAGDEVEVEICEKNIIRSILLIYIGPILFLLLGFIAGNNFSETIGIAAGAAFMLAFFLGLKLLERKIAASSIPQVLRVL